MQPFEKILMTTKKIVIVGLSRDPLKASHDVAKYLQSNGYKIIPVHPAAIELIGEKVFHSISEIKEPIDIIDVFRPAEECEEITKEAVKLRPKMIWLQLGIENENAKKVADEKGVVFVQNKCTKIEHQRLFGF